MPEGAPHARLPVSSLEGAEEHVHPAGFLELSAPQSFDLAVTVQGKPSSCVASRHEGLQVSQGNCPATWPREPGHCGGSRGSGTADELLHHGAGKGLGLGSHVGQ